VAKHIGSAPEESISDAYRDSFRSSLTEEFRVEQDLRVGGSVAVERQPCGCAKL